MRIAKDSVSKYPYLLLLSLTLLGCAEDLPTSLELIHETSKSILLEDELQDNTDAIRFQPETEDTLWHKVLNKDSTLSFPIVIELFSETNSQEIIWSRQTYSLSFASISNTNDGYLLPYQFEGKYYSSQRNTSFFSTPYLIYLAEAGDSILLHFSETLHIGNENTRHTTVKQGNSTSTSSFGPITHIAFRGEWVSKNGKIELKEFVLNDKTLEKDSIMTHGFTYGKLRKLNQGILEGIFKTNRDIMLRVRFTK